jgi:hypothetical protein
MKRMKLLGAIAALGALLVTGLLVSPASASTIVTTPNGTWGAYPGQSTTYQTSVQPPINTDGSSNYKATSKAVIPVKFGLSQGTGAFVFESYVDSDPATYPYSFLNWNSGTQFTLDQLTQLSAVYDFTVGDCHAGSLRWTLTLNDGGVEKNLDIHYQPGQNGISDQFCAPGTSGHNMADLTSSDPYVVIQEFTGTHTFSSAYNVTYSEAVSQLGTLNVVGATLIVDSGFAGNERVNLTSATVGVTNAAPYTETFIPQPASALSPVCPTQQASILVTKTDGTSTGAVNEALSIQPSDDNGIFRIVDCKYMYNLATTSLRGVGTYKVYAIINGVQATNPAVFDLK